MHVPACSKYCSSLKPTINSSLKAAVAMTRYKPKQTLFSSVCHISCQCSCKLDYEDLKVESASYTAWAIYRKCHIHCASL